MRNLAILVVGVGLLACDKPNPNFCCSTEADCMAQGLPTANACADGLICRGNQCIAEICSISSDCDAAAPYCITDLDGRCTETCTDNSQCPGFGQSADNMFCESGGCVECRMGMDDCSVAAPICDSGACRTCTANSECASGVCAGDGSCVDESMIAFVAPNGSAVADCTRVSPCSLPHGLTISRPYIELASGTYQLAATVTITGTTSLVGSGPTRPIITTSVPGTILSIANGADVTFSGLQVSGAMGDSSGKPGIGIDCPIDPTGSRTIHLDDVVLSMNENVGLRTRGCTTTARLSTFSDNGFGSNELSGIETTDSTGTFDRCVVTRNGGTGINFDGGLYTLTNSFVVRNVGGAIAFFSQTLGNRIEFNTIVDNASGVSCSAQFVSYPNNIIARNGALQSGTCSFAGSIISTDVAALHFVSPDVAPFDYHINTGSSAIDQAIVSTVDHDFDGDARPQGAGKDIGADELKQP